jgi:hypothetical protein
MGTIASAWMQIEPFSLKERRTKVTADAARRSLAARIGETTPPPGGAEPEPDRKPGSLASSTPRGDASDSDLSSSFSAQRILSNRIRLHQAVHGLLSDASASAGRIAQVRHRRTGRTLPCRLSVDGLHELEQSPFGMNCWTKGRVSIGAALPRGRVLRRIEVDVIAVGVAGRIASVAIADNPIWERRVDDAGWIRIRTPRICGPASILVTLSIDPFVPRERGDISLDDRQLGLAIREIRLLLDDTLPRRIWSSLVSALRGTKR